MKIGFVGFGTMGQPMVEHLIKAGHELRVWSRRAASADFAVALGATRCESVAEAFNFAAKSGVDAAKVREALLGGFAYSKVLENHGQRMLDRNFKPGFKAWMHQKDLRIVMEEAHRLGLMLPAAAATAQLFNAIVGSGMGDDDSIAALKLLEKLSSAE